MQAVVSARNGRGKGGWAPTLCATRTCIYTRPHGGRGVRMLNSGRKVYKLRIQAAAVPFEYGRGDVNFGQQQAEKGDRKEERKQRTFRAGQQGIQEHPAPSAQLEFRRTEGNRGTEEEVVPHTASGIVAPPAPSIPPADTLDDLASNLGVGYGDDEERRNDDKGNNNSEEEEGGGAESSLPCVALVQIKKAEQFAQSTTALFLELVAFTAPLLAIWVSGPILSLVDAVVVGATSTLELAALGPAVSLADQATYLCSFLAIATTNLLAVAEGKGRKEDAERALRDALALAGLVGVFAASLGLVGAEPVLRGMINAGGGDVAMLRPAVDYLKIRALAMPAALIGMVVQSSFLAWKLPLFPLLSMFCAASLNLIGDIFLCSYMKMGCGGAAWATAAAQVGGTLFLLRTLYKEGKAKRLPVAVKPIQAIVRWPGLKTLLTYATLAGPICFVLLTKVLMYSSVTFFTSSLGTVNLAAHVATYSTFIFFAVLGDSTNQAAQTYMPGRLHSIAATKQLVKVLLFVGLGVGMFTSMASGGFLYAFPTLFSSADNVISVIRETVPAISLTLLFHAVGLTAEGMLLAGRDVAFLCKSYVVNLLLTITTLYVGYVKGWGLPGIWLSIGQFMLVRLVTLSFRLLSSKSILRGNSYARIE